MKTILPGIVKVGYVDCAALSPGIALKARAGVPVSVLTDINWLDVQGDGTCESVASYNNHGQQEATTLQFFTTSDLPTRRRLAFVVVTADGSRRLIGAAEPPYAQIECTTFTGEAGGQRAGRQVKVSLKSVKSLVRLA